MAELVSIKRNVDVSPGQAAPAVFHCSQGDVGSKIILGLLNNGTAYSIPSGVTVTIEGSESNGSIFTPISATASGSDITFYLTGEMTAVAGPAICQAVLKSGSNILGTANFTLEVESSPMGADAPPVFTDAGWTWMLQKLTTEIVPALGDDIVDAIDSKADQTGLTALSNTVAGHTGSITVLNNTVNTLNGDVTENRQNIATKLDKNQGTANAGKYLKVQSSGQVVPVDLIDDSLLVETMAADSKATGDALNTKLNKNQGANNSGKYLKVGADGTVETAELDVTTDKTLSIADKAADAKAVGDELTVLKADLTTVNNDLKKTSSVDFNAYYTVKTIISSTTGLWYNNSRYNAVFIPIPSGASSVYIHASSFRKTIYAFLTDNTHTNNATPNYAEGSTRSEIPDNSSLLIPIPSDAKYIYVCTVADNLDYTPSSIEFNYSENAVYNEISLSFELGGVNILTGELVDNNIRLRNTLGIPYFVDKITADDGYSFVIIGCSFASATYYGSWNGFSWSDTVNQLQYIDMNSVRGLADYFLIMIRKIDGGEIAVLDATHVHFWCHNVSKFAGLKYAALGDSITYGFIPRNTFGYPGQLKSFANLTAMRLGMTFVNQGISGSTLAYHETRDPMSRRFNDLPDDADIITVMGGTNDIRNGITLGTMNDRDDSTFYGALHVVYGGLYKKFMIDQGVVVGKRKKIIAITPIKLLQASASEQGGTGTLYDFEPWVNAVKEVAAYYSIPVLDFYNLSGINPHLNETIKGTVTGYTGYYNPYITDGTHPTREGADIMSDVLIGFLNSIT